MDSKRNWLDRPIHPALPALTNEIVVFALVILLAIATRFYDLESRVMSHDESLHTYFSWLLYRGQGGMNGTFKPGTFFVGHKFSYQRVELVTYTSLLGF